MKRFVSILCLLAVLAGFLTGCGKRDATVEQFKKTAEQHDLLIEDWTEQQNGNVVAALAAYRDMLQIEFYLVESERQTRQAFSENIALFTYGKENGDKSDKWAGDFGKDDYVIVSAADKSFVVAIAPKDQQKELEQIVSELGY